ncbi:hypothetical protein Y032_0008g109 [Ancylostoma ceylanicum]|uniref:Uncharacterized protein n=1 Tax=Ancylostoma ceylanicum TaxID=53326 RepID=A0A016VLM5_9BILA|nr:hypothetical protein Y032_0008g109 [Ancylostoma ceylanicum]
MVTFVLLEAENHSSLMELIEYATIKSMKFTVATDVNKLLPSCNGDSTDKAQLATETNSCTGESVVASTNAGKIAEAPVQSREGTASDTGTISAALLLEESASGHFQNVKREANDQMDAWENDTPFIPIANHHDTSWAALGNLSDKDHLKDGDALSPETIDWSTVTPVIEAVEKAQSGEITDIVNATSQLSQLTVSVAMVCSSLIQQMYSMKRSFIALQCQVSKKVDTNYKSAQGLKFCLDNQRQHWILPAHPPFVELDMTNELRHFTPPTRAASREYLVMIDFFRRVLLKLHSNPPEIRRYAVRLQNFGRDSLLDLPEEIVQFFINFALDGLGLRADELRRGQKELLIGSNNDFWIRLGVDDTSREKEWDRRMELLGSWPSHARAAVSQAMEDVRRYVVIDGKLRPPPKRAAERSSSTRSAKHARSEENDDDDLDGDVKGVTFA